MNRHVVFGTGQVGRHVVARLVELGHDVVAVNRSGRGDFHGAEVVGGDVTDAVFAKDVTRGAGTVYFCLNASNYHRWPQEFPPLQDAVVGAAAASGARLGRTREPLRVRRHGWSAHDGGNTVAS